MKSDTSQSDSPTLTTRCPRCGYDLRGTVATWTESCPLTGVCSECGLMLSWPDVLMPEKYEPLWCIEFAPGQPRRRKIALAAVWTFGRSFWPWGFWSRIRMSHAVRPRRLLLYVVLLMLPLLLTYPVVQAAGAVRMRNTLHRDIVAMTQGMQQYVTRVQNWQSDAVISSIVQSQPTDEAKQRYIAALQANAAQYQAMIANSRAINISYLEAVFEAVVLPLSKTSRGSISNQSGSVMYPPPIRLFDDVRAGGRGPVIAARTLATRGWTAHPILGLARPDGPVTLTLFLTLFYPLTMLLAPITLRRAKVRFGHLVRTLAYSMWIPAMVAYIAVGGSVVSMALGAEPDFASRHTTALLSGAALALFLWWAAAIRCYLRLPRPEFVAAMLAVLTLLAFAGAWYVAGESLGLFEINWLRLNRLFGTP